MKYKNQKIKMSLFFNLLKKHTDIVELKDMNDVMSSALGFIEPIDVEVLHLNPKMIFRLNLVIISISVIFV